MPISNRRFFELPEVCFYSSRCRLKICDTAAISQIANLRYESRRQRSLLVQLTSENRGRILVEEPRK